MGVSFEPILHPNKFAYTRVCLRFVFIPKSILAKLKVSKCGFSPKKCAKGKGGNISCIVKLPKSTIGKLLNILEPIALATLTPKVLLIASWDSPLKNTSNAS